MFKNAYGDWCEETIIDLDNRRRLTICTMKRYSKQLVTSAMVTTSEGGFYTHAMYSDYAYTVERSQPARCTKGAVADQHARAMSIIDAIKCWANNHYVCSVG